MTIKTPPFIIFDWESGGYESTKNPVIEFAGISIYGDTLETITQFESIITYYDSSLIYEDQALQANHITHEMIKHGSQLKEFMTNLINFFNDSTPHSGAKYKPVLVGHNPKFDIPFLQQIFQKSNKDLSKFLAGKENYFGNFEPDYLDTIRLSQLLWGNDPDMISHKLIDCVNKAGLELVDAHRSMNDVVATKDLFTFIINKLRSNQSIQNEQNQFRKNFKF